MGWRFYVHEWAQILLTCWDHWNSTSGDVLTASIKFLRAQSPFTHKAVHVFSLGGCTCKLYNLLLVPQQASISTFLAPLHPNRTEFGTRCEFVMTHLKGRKRSTREGLIIAHLGPLNLDWISDWLCSIKWHSYFCRIICKTILHSGNENKEIFCLRCTWIL